ncbi:MAG: PTS system fructose-specific EIIABC component [Phycisphaerae bacterium]|nr:PTS system fructose-specific EIIABC component [Phycisphaerae bacterium]
MVLTEILDPNCILAPMKASDKRGAIEELVAVLADQGKTSDKAKLLQAVMEREATRTTGIGNGLAIPHGKSASVSALVMAIGKPASPIEFEAIDGKPVSLIVLLASPFDQTGPHIQALARISRLMTIESFRDRLIAAESGQALFSIIQRQEAQMADARG